MALSLEQAIKGIERLEAMFVRSTRHAEQQLANVCLEFNGDGSGRVLFKWTQRIPAKHARNQMEQGFLNLMATVEADEEMSETFESFDTLDELEFYLRSHRVIR